MNETKGRATCEVDTPAIWWRVDIKRVVFFLSHWFFGHKQKLHFLLETVISFIFIK